MAELVGSGGGRRDRGAHECMPNNRSHRTLRQKAANGGSGAQEYPTTGAAGPAMAQIGHDRLAHILRQGKLGPAATLAVYAQIPGLPVNVLELQKGHFPRTQTQAGEQQQDRVVASPNGSTAIDIDSAGGVLDRVQSRGESRASTSSPRTGRPRPNPIGSRRGNVRTAKTSAAPWSGASLASGAAAAPVVGQTATTSLARRLDSFTGPVAETLFEEPANERRVVDDRRLRQNALLAQVLLVGLHALFGRREWIYWYLVSGNHPFHTEELDETSERGSIPLVRSPPPIPKSQKPCWMFGRDPVGWNLRLFDPSAEACSERCRPWRAKRGPVVPGSDEGALFTRSREAAQGKQSSHPSIASSHCGSAAKPAPSEARVWRSGTDAGRPGHSWLSRRRVDFGDWDVPKSFTR